MLKQVRLLRRHITKGEKFSPAALAIAETLGVDITVEVSAAFTKFSWYDEFNKYHKYVTKTPPLLTNFIWSFDDSEKVKPFDFYIDLPIEVMERRKQLRKK
jgi:hypothetical protein